MIFIIPALCLLAFFSFFIKVFICSVIINKEEDTEYVPYMLRKLDISHTIECSFTFWIKPQKKENKTLAVIHNSIFIFIVVVFLLTGIYIALVPGL